jgi:hypothetical protein
MSNKKILPTEGIKPSNKVVARNHNEPKTEDRKKIDLEQPVDNKDSAVKKDLMEPPCLLLMVSSDQDFNEDNLSDKDADDQIKDTDNESINYDNRDLTNGMSVKMDKDKFIDRVLNDAVICRSSRPKNLKSTISDDFLWVN